RKRVPLASDKTVARVMLADLVRKAERGEAGLEDEMTRARERPLAQHLEDYRRYILAKGNTQVYADRARNKCLVVLEACEADTLDDLQPSAVLEALAGLREPDPPAAELPDGQEWFTLAEAMTVL